MGLESSVLGKSKMGLLMPCPPPSTSEGAEGPGTSMISEAASLRITIPSPDSTRRKQWKAEPTTIRTPTNASRLPAPLPAKRPRGRPRGSTTKRKDASSAPIATRKVDSRVNAVASSSTVTLDALNVAQPAWRVVSPAPCATVASDQAPANAPSDPRTSALPGAPRRVDLRKRKHEHLPADDGPRKKRRGTSTASGDGPRWLPPRLGATRTMPTAQDGLTCAHGTRPRIWAGNKADLYAVLPQLFGTKATNSPISTMVDYMPVVVLDEESVQVSMDEADPLCCRLTIKLFCEGPMISPKPASEVTVSTALQHIIMLPSTEHRPEPAPIPEGIQADDAKNTLPFEAGYTLEHRALTPRQLVAQDSQGAPETNAVASLAVSQDLPDEGQELKRPPVLPKGLPIVPLVYAPEILTELWQLALSYRRFLDARVLDESTLRGDLAVGQVETLFQTRTASILEMQPPAHLPPDVDALHEALTHQYPVLLVASRATLATFWRVLVPEEYACCFLGLFHLTGMQDMILRGSNGAPLTTVDRDGRAITTVQWTVTLRWMEGGEGFLGHEALRRPWWVSPCPEQLPIPTPTPTIVDKFTISPSASIPQHIEQSTRDKSSYPCEPPPTSMAAMARTWLSYLPPAAMTVFPDDRDRKASVPEDDRGVYPSFFVPRVDHCLSDDTFPSGWCCWRCGRINLQLCMRRRLCASATCMAADAALTKEAQHIALDCESAASTRAGVGYTLRLDDVRDPRDTIPLAQPLSVYSSGVQSFMAEAEDGMRIVEVRERQTTIGKAVVKSNEPKLPTSLVAVENMPNQDAAIVNDPADVADNQGRNADESELRTGPLLVTHIFTCNMRSLQADADQLFLDVQRYAHLRRTRVSENIFRCELPVAGVLPLQGDDQETSDDGPTEGLSRRLHDHLVERADEYMVEDLDIPIRRLLLIAGIGAGSRKLPDTFNATIHPVTMLCLGCDARLTISSSRLGSAKASRVKVKAEDDDDAEEEQKANAADPGNKLVNLSVGMVHGDVLVLTNDVYQISFKRTGTSILVVGCS